jgi:formate dehydrogenase gamma subunit
MLGFLGYIALDLLARIRGRTGHPRHEAEGGEKERQFERLTLNQRIQHWALILSFAVLVATGLPLLYPQSGVSQGVIHFLGGVGLRPAVHRGAAILQIGLVLYHGLYVLFSRRGYWEFRQLLPAFQDARDLFQMLSLYLGLGTTRPAFGRYNYIEKFEYLAVGWGSVIMIGTGLLLWAPHLTLSILPKWVMDITLVVHSWEALLAFLAIIVWHMYNVHWNPSAFPMSTVWLTGKIGEREFRENHPLEYQQQVGRKREKGDDPK